MTGTETAIEVNNLTKVFGPSRRDAGVTAVDNVTVSLDAGRVHGLLGRNGAGKTTLMKLITGQIFATSGQVRIFGQDPVENPATLSRTCFIQESQTYPDQLTAGHLLAVARHVYPNWDSEFATRLVEQFALPLDRRICKLSRGQRSAVGIILGLASRAEVTMFDEPYLGLDAVARMMFFDLLLADVADHPRTVVLSTHHIDEAADLLEHIVVLDGGRVTLDEDTESVRARAFAISGPTQAVVDFTSRSAAAHVETLGPVATASVLGALTGTDREQANHLGLVVSPISLQTAFVHLLSDATRDHAADPGHRDAARPSATESRRAHR